MHKYLEFISLGRLIENEPVAFNGHGNLKEHITCACRETDMFTPRLYRLEIATEQEYIVSVNLTMLFSDLSNVQKSFSSICFKRESCLIFFNTADLVFVRHLNMTPAEMSQRTG